MKRKKRSHVLLSGNQTTLMIISSLVSYISARLTTWIKNWKKSFQTRISRKVNKESRSLILKTWESNPLTYLLIFIKILTPNTWNKPFKREIKSTQLLKAIIKRERTAVKIFITKFLKRNKNKWFPKSYWIYWMKWIKT